MNSHKVDTLIGFIAMRRWFTAGSVLNSLNSDVPILNFEFSVLLRPLLSVFISGF